MSRGYREKWLHKNLQKNKESICRSLLPDKLVQPGLVESIVNSTAGQLIEEEGKEEDTHVEEGQEGDLGSDGGEAMDTAPSTQSLTNSNGLSHSHPQASATSSGSGVWDPVFPDEAVRAARHVLGNLKAMEQRLFDAHLQLKVTL